MKELDYTDDHAFEASLIQCLTLDAKPIFESKPILERIQLMDEMFQALEEKPNVAGLIYQLPDWARPAFCCIGDVLIVGREPHGESSCNFLAFPEHSSLSRNHFQIARDQGLFVLEDEGSRNGTFLNSDEKRKKHHLLKSGDFIYAGGILFSFVGDLDQGIEQN